MIIGDITYYALEQHRAHGKEPRLVRTPDFDPAMPRPTRVPYADYLSVWRATNGVGFCALPGSKVYAAACRYHMTLPEYLACHSDMDARTIAAIKTQYSVMA